MSGNSTVYRVSVSPLAVSEVAEILKCPLSDKILTLPPVKPKGGQVFVFSSTSSFQRGLFFINWSLLAIFIKQPLYEILLITFINFTEPNREWLIELAFRYQTLFL